MNSLFEISGLHKTHSGLRWTYLMCFSFILGTFQLTKAQQSKNPIQKIHLTSESSLENNEKETITICGIVSDSTNQPLAGVAVIVQNTTIGVTTNLHGEFSIKVHPNIINKHKNLTFSFIGYLRKVVPINQDSNNMEIVMNMDSNGLNNLIVVGMPIRPTKRQLRKIKRKRRKLN